MYIFKILNVKKASFVSFGLTFMLLIPVYGNAKSASVEYLAAAEEIGVLSQSIVKNYFYLGEKYNVSRSAQKLDRQILEFDRNVEILKSFDQADKIKDDLMFVEMIGEEFKATLAEDYGRDTGLLVIDMGEVLLEGSENISKVLYGPGQIEGNMIDIVEHQRYLIERMAKLYIVSIAGFKDFNVGQQATSTVKTFDEGLQKIEVNNYPEDVKSKVEKLRRRWESSRGYYLSAEEGDLPRTVFFNTEMIERLLADIFKYHK